MCRSFFAGEGDLGDVIFLYLKLKSVILLRGEVGFFIREGLVSEEEVTEVSEMGSLVVSPKN